VRRADGFAEVFAALKETGGAAYLCADPLVNANRPLLIKLASESRVPTMGDREYTDAGGLVSYGPSLADLARRAAEQVNKILRDTKPGDLPVEQPVKFDFVLNLKAAKAIGLSVPQALLVQADEVIE